MIAYTTWYGSLNKDQLHLYLFSIESFLVVNKDLPLYVVLINTPEGNEYLTDLQNRYGINRLLLKNVILSTSEEVLWKASRTYRFSFRFSKAVLNCLGDTKVISIDCDLLHENPFPLRELHWDKINAAPDRGYQWYPDDFSNSFERSFNKRLAFYVNAGVLAFDTSKNTAFWDSFWVLVTQACRSGKDSRFHDQDIINYLLHNEPNKLNVLSTLWNYQYECHDVEAVKKTYYQYWKRLRICAHHLISNFGEAGRLDLASMLANTAGWGTTSVIKKDLTTKYSPQLLSKVVETLENFTVMIIARNQTQHIEEMVSSLRTSLPGVNILYVLDRCTDNSKEILEQNNVPFVEKTTGEGFDAGGSRNFGYNLLNKEQNILFLDGDRIPTGLSWTLIVQALKSYDMTMLKVEHDHRDWFNSTFSSNTWYGNGLDNAVYSCGMLLSTKAHKSIASFNPGNNLMHPIFSGRYGEEDVYLGDVARHLDLTCGGFPEYVYLRGAFNSKRDEVDKVVSRHKRRILFEFLTGSTNKLPDIPVPAANLSVSAKTRSFLMGVRAIVPPAITSSNPFSQDYLRGLREAFSKYRIGKDRREYPIVMFYFVAQIGDWKEIYEQQVQRITSSSLYNLSNFEIQVITIGKEALVVPDKFRVVHQSDNLLEYEYPALKVLHEYATNNPLSNIIYIHTKGATSQSLYNKDAIVSWRKFLEYYTLDRWEENQLLLSSCDALGPMLSTEDGVSYFGGNFWWACSEYISKLPDPMLMYSEKDRFSAERWIGLSKGLFLNLKTYPGFDPYFSAVPEADYRMNYHLPGADLATE